MVLAEFLRRIGLAEHPVAGSLDPAERATSFQQVGADIACHRGFRRDPDEGFRFDIDRTQEFKQRCGIGCLRERPVRPVEVQLG